MKNYVGKETFCFTYGDGVSDINIEELIKYHKSKNASATLTAVEPIGRFGRLILEGDYVSNFEEKPHGDQGY